MLTTTTHRSHWMDPVTGRTYESRYLGRMQPRRDDLVPVINLDEVRDYVTLGRGILPGDASTPTGEDHAVWHMGLLLELVEKRGADFDQHYTHRAVVELTDDVPTYRKELRGPFMALRMKRSLPRDCVRCEIPSVRLVLPVECEWAAIRALAQFGSLLVEQVDEGGARRTIVRCWRDAEEVMRALGPDLAALVSLSLV